MTTKLTIRDIARLAGVSKSTVSRVLNAHPKVDVETRERILTVVQENGFIPNAAATGLAKGHSRLIGLIAARVELPQVGIDNAAATYIAIRHLLDLGHRRIGFILGLPEIQCTHDRYEGYCKALSDAGIALDPSLVLQGNYQCEGGYTCAPVFRHAQTAYRYFRQQRPDRLWRPRSSRRAGNPYSRRYGPGRL